MPAWTVTITGHRGAYKALAVDGEGISGQGREAENIRGAALDAIHALSVKTDSGICDCVGCLIELHRSL